MKKWGTIFIGLILTVLIWGSFTSATTPWNWAQVFLGKVHTWTGSQTFNSINYIRNDVTSISTATSLTEPGYYDVSGAVILTFFDPTNYVGSITVITGDTSGVSIWNDNAGSFNEIGTAAGATLTPTSAPWMIEFVPVSSTSTYAVAKVGTFNVTPE